MSRDALFTRKKKLPLRVLSQDDWEHWERRGYAIVRKAISHEKVIRMVTTLLEFCEMDPTNPNSWYRTGDKSKHLLPDLTGSGMVEIFDRQYMWNIRQDPRVYNEFVDIWDCEDLRAYPSHANLTPKNRGSHQFKGFVY